MKKIILFVGTFTSLLAFAQEKKEVERITLPLIPLPNGVQIRADSFVITPATKLVVFNDFFKNETDYLNDYLKNNYDFTLPIVSELPTDGSYVALTQPDFGDVSKERYSLDVNQNQIIINADGTAGMFYGMQTLIQLMPLQKSKKLIIHSVSIKDAPRYEWRGMHLDCSRHFFTKVEVEKYIDYLAVYKYNVFHWHLVDDQGWRIEIKKYPLLTSVGSKRKETIIGKPKYDKDWKPAPDSPYDGIPYSGFYTQEDIKEVIVYAEKRHITIVPEIEMPGHSQAALASYPQYSCTGGPFETLTRWGQSDDDYCAGNDSTFDFLEDILTELMALFPSKYIHIGGDECSRKGWKTCVKCQKRIANEKLKDEVELQSYFIKRIEKYVNSKGKQIIGWDEILDGGLAPNAAVMSWRGTKGGIEAAKQNHYVVMTPGKPCYFDHYQAKDKDKEPLAIGGYNPLDSVYAYNPTPKALTANEQKYILGAQGNVWTEYITDFTKVEYMSMPRMAALAEAVWTQPEKKEYKNFIIRLKKHSKVLDKMGVNYAHTAFGK